MGEILSTEVVIWKWCTKDSPTSLCDDRPVDHRALVTAPFRGEGLSILEDLADVVLDPWIDQLPMRLYDAEQLAARVEAESADLLVVESDFVSGPVFDLPLLAV